MFDRILVPLDGSLLAETSLPHTIALAQAFNAEVILLHVIAPMTDAAGENRSIDRLDWKIRECEAEYYLEKLSSRMQNIGLKTQAILLEGGFPESVLSCAEYLAVDLIAVSSHGQGGLNGWSTGSDVQKIIHAGAQARVRTSMLIVPAYRSPAPDQESQRYRRILVPLDGSQQAECGLFFAGHLAHAQDAELLLAHVIKPPDMPSRTPLSMQETALVRRLMDHHRAAANTYLNELKGRLNCCVNTCLLVGDSVASSLHALIQEKNIDLIILSAHGYNCNESWPYGSITINFLTYGTTTLLVVQDFDQERIKPNQTKIPAKELWSPAYQHR